MSDYPFSPTKFKAAFLFPGVAEILKSGESV